MWGTAIATGRVAHEMNKNVAGALSWEYLFKQLGSRTQPA